MKMSFNYDANKTYFHNKGFALSLVLKVRFFGTRKWPINRKVQVKVKRGLLVQIYVYRKRESKFL